MAGSEQERIYLEKLSSEEEKARDDIVKAATMNLAEFMNSHEDEKLLAFIKFLYGNKIVSCSIGERLAGFPYGELDIKLIEVIKPYLSSEFHRTKHRDEKTFRSDEKLPRGLEAYAGKPLVLEIRTFPFAEIKDRKGIAVQQIEYFTAGTKTNNPARICEDWIVKRVDFSQTKESGKNTDTRLTVSGTVLQPSRIVGAYIHH